MKKQFTALVVLILALTLAAGTVSLADLTSDLVGFWPMDGSAKDRAGSNNGTLEGGAKTVADGQRGNVLSVDGKDSYVSIPDSPAFDITGDFSISFWMKPSKAFNSSSAMSMPAVGKFGSGDYQLVFNLTGTDYGVGAEGMNTLLVGGMAFKIEDKSEGNSFLYVGSLIDLWEANTWYHITGVYKEEAVSAFLYVDGELQNTSKTWDSSAAVLEKVGGPLEIGRCTMEQAGNAVKYFEGMLDDVALYSRALELEEVQALAGGATILAVEKTDGKLASTWGSIKD